MARPYNNALADYTPAFPGAPYTPRDFRNEQWPGYPVEDEPFTVPADADADGKYRLMLDLVPFDQLDFQLTVAGSLRVPVPYGEAVPPGRVGVSLLNGVIEFNEADAGESGLCSYTGRASALDAGALNQIGAEVKATQEALGSATVYRSFTIVGSAVVPENPTDPCHVLEFESNELPKVRLVRMQAYSPPDQNVNVSGNTVLQVANNAAFDNAVNFTAGSTSPLLVSSFDLVITSPQNLYCRIVQSGNHVNMAVEFTLMRETE